MKILSIGFDRNLFKEHSAVRQRIIEYGSLVEELHIVIFSKKGFSDTKIAGNIFLYPTNSSTRWLYIFDAARIGKKIISSAGQWLITTDSLEAGLAGYMIKRKQNISWQMQIHGDFLSPYFKQESYLNKIRVWLAKFLIPRADKIRVVSGRIKHSIISNFRNIDVSKITLLPIFVDAKNIQESQVKTDLHEKYSQFGFIILIASRLAKVKNIDMAIETMQEIIKSHPKTGLIIVGEGKDEASLKLKVNSLKLSDNIIFEPWSDDLPSYYKTADLFLVTSNHEGWGMTSVEAMAGGCPLIMTDVGCAGELVKNEYNGLVIPVGSKEGLIKNIKRMINEPALREKLRNNAIESIKSLPTKEQYLNEYKKTWST